MDHTRCPFHVLVDPLPIPASRRAFQHGSKVGYLVGQLDGLRANGFLRSVQHLKALSFRLGQRLVIGHFEHQGSDVRSEPFDQFCLGDARVFDHIVKQRCGDEIVIGFVEGSGNQMRHFDQMIDVGFGGSPLPLLIGMPLCSEECGLELFE